MATIIRKGHTIKAGIDHRLQRANNYQREVPSGSFSFPGGLTGNPQNQTGTGNGFAQFLLGSVSSASFVALWRGVAARLFDQPVRAGRLEALAAPERQSGDALGLPAVAERAAQWALQLRPVHAQPGYGAIGAHDLCRRRLRAFATGADYKNFSPRIGFAYDLMGDGKTVLRAAVTRSSTRPHSIGISSATRPGSPIPRRRTLRRAATPTCRRSSSRTDCQRRSYSHSDQSWGRARSSARA